LLHFELVRTAVTHTASYLWEEGSCNFVYGIAGLEMRGHLRLG
jgi:hypothetical protein